MSVHTPGPSPPSPRLQELRTGVEGLRKLSQWKSADLLAVQLEQPFSSEACEHLVELGGGEGLDAAWQVAAGVHDITPKYALKSMPGQFTGLHLVSLMFVGFRQIDPSLEGGIDLSPEYAEAKKLFMLM